MPTPDQIANHPPMANPRAPGLTTDEGGRRWGRTAVVLFGGAGALTGCGPVAPAETPRPIPSELVLPTFQTETVIVSPILTREGGNLVAMTTAQVEEAQKQTEEADAAAQREIEEEATRVAQETANAQATTQR